MTALAAGVTLFGAPVTKTVRIVDISFKPSMVRIHRGDSVLWRFEDPDLSHTVTSVGAKRFRGSGVRGSGTYRVRFAKTGTYRYVCTIHPNMSGRVVVH